MKRTNRKIILSGSTVEEYNYTEKALLYDFSVPAQSRIRTKIEVTDEASKIRKEESKRRSLQRTRSNLRRLINTNAWQWLKTTGEPYLPVFVTFTFGPNIQNVKEANRIFSHFIKRLNHYVKHDGTRLKYSVVVEFQERGAVHYHTIFYNLDYIKKNILAGIWGQGYIKIKGITNVSNAGAYVCKYMSKDLCDDRLDGLKRYFSSRNLHKPLHIIDQYKAEKVSKLIPPKYKTKEKEFESVYQGKVKYTQYNLGKTENIFTIIPDLKTLL